MKTALVSVRRLTDGISVADFGVHLMLSGPTILFHPCKRQTATRKMRLALKTASKLHYSLLNSNPVPL